MSEQNPDILTSQSPDIKELFNPFPGLRPFGMDESHLFFGREGQSDDVLLKLSNNRFVTIVGASGSGKSSLVYSGLIPIIHGAFIPEISEKWVVINSRPGISPIDNLAQSIMESDPDAKSLSQEDKFIKNTINSTVLRSTSLGLVESIQQIRSDQNENFLLVIDQFEELFRYQRNVDHDTGYNESMAFVNLLLEAISQTKVPIYVVLTMRSDFIGECAQFPELTQKINQSHYLIPQMTRDQKRMAIEGPVAVGGGEISSRLIQRLLNDLGDNQDQLPLMQHALMRTWNRWQNSHEAGEPLDIRHYEEIGTIEEALSQHANEAYDELSEEDKDLSEVLFKSITEKKGGSNYGIRRPTKIKYIAAIAGVTEEAIINVVDKFREPGRSLLMPPAGKALNGESIIDISHESLMRIWVRLKDWVEEENEASVMYLRLCDAAQSYQMGKSGLWRPPDLQIALNWQERYNPSIEWAQRYDPAFERAMVFLRTSKQEYDAEQRSKELLQKRRLRNANIVALILSGIAIIAILFLVYAFQQKGLADQAAVEATAARDEAIENEKIADALRIEAESERNAAEEARQRAEEQRLIAVAERNAADSARAFAETQRQRAIRQQGIAVRERDNAEQQKVIAIRQEQLAIEEAQRADAASLDALNARYRAIAQSMAVKSLQQKEVDIKGLNAYQAYLFNQKYDGREYDNYIYDGLYYATKAMTDDSKNLLEAHVDGINAIEYTNDGKYLYTAGSDGNVIRWDMNGGNNEPTIIQTNNEIENRILALSPDNKWLAVGTTGNSIQLIDLTKENPSPKRITGHNGLVWDIKFLPDNSGFFSAGIDSTIRFYNFESLEVFARGKAPFDAISISPDGSKLAAGDDVGTVTIFNTRNSADNQILPDSNKDPVYSIAYNHGGDKLVVSHAKGDEDVELRIWNTADYSLGNILTGHEARVDKLKFSNNDKLLASASHDGTVRIWVMDELTSLPMVLNDHEGWVLSIEFSPDDKEIITGTSLDQLRIWKTDPSQLAANFCEKLTRNMTDNEWKQYVAKDIDYIATCSELNKE